LVSDLNLSLAPGNAMIITGESGTGCIQYETFCAALESVALPRYTHRLDEVNDWAKVLSPASSSASRSPGCC
jgi:ABC-type uncharacterized transport system fused permease/ATPase subunit